LAAVDEEDYPEDYTVEECYRLRVDVMEPVPDGCATGLLEPDSAPALVAKTLEMNVLGVVALDLLGIGAQSSVECGLEYEARFEKDKDLRLVIGEDLRVLNAVCVGTNVGMNGQGVVALDLLGVGALSIEERGLEYEARYEKDKDLRLEIGEDLRVLNAVCVGTNVGMLAETGEDLRVLNAEFCVGTDVGMKEVVNKRGRRLRRRAAVLLIDRNRQRA
jgi:hypothetical protein